jgi:hypothetical protein
MYPEPELAVQLRRAIAVRVRLKPDATGLVPLNPGATDGQVASGGPFGTTIRVRVVG